MSGAQAEAAGPCGLCELRAERGIEPPPGGCTCQAPRTAAPAALRAGACPSWCATDHGELMVPGRPEYGTVQAHWSAPANPFPPRIRLVLNPVLDLEPRVCVDLPTHGGATLYLLAGQADALAELLWVLGGQGREEDSDSDLIAADIRVAAALARKTVSLVQDAP